MWIIQKTDHAAFLAFARVFAAMARREAGKLPVIRRAIGHVDDIFRFTSGFCRAGLTLGGKAGG